MNLEFELKLRKKNRTWQQDVDCRREVVEAIAASPEKAAEERRRAGQEHPARLERRPVVAVKSNVGKFPGLAQPLHRHNLLLEVKLLLVVGGDVPPAFVFLADSRHPCTHPNV